MNIFEVTDKSGRKIHLTKERWSHIRKKHPEVENIEEVKEAIGNPTKITFPKFDNSVGFYYKYFKHKASPDKFLLVLVKYLNGAGYVVTAYYEDKIK
jgi:hypothetical protein